MHQKGSLLLNDAIYLIPRFVFGSQISVQDSSIITTENFEGSERSKVTGAYNYTSYKQQHYFG